MGARSQPARVDGHYSTRQLALLVVYSLALSISPASAVADTRNGSSDLFAARDVPSGNVTCKDPKVTWYNNAAGLNPCQQYERLRRICQPSFRVPSLPRELNPTSTPGTCDTQLTECCCNSVSFNLAVTCAACQWGVGTGAEKDFGIDAAPGTYQAYLGKCIGGSFNQSIPKDPQTAVCNTGLDIPGFLYKSFWTDGALYFHYMYERAVLLSNAGNSSSGHCTMNGTLASQNKGASNGGGSSGPDKNVIIAIIGGVLGGLGLLSTLAVLLWVKYRGNKRKSTKKTHPLPSFDFDGSNAKRTWRDYRPVPAHRLSDSISGTSSLLNSGSTTLPASDPSTPTPYVLSARTSTAEHEIDPFDALPRPRPRAQPSPGLVIGSGSDTRRDAKLRTIERHPDGKAPLPYTFDMEPGSTSGGGSTGARSGRRDEKLRAVERHPDGKLSMPYAFESDGAGGSSAREVKVARLEDTLGTRAGKRRDDSKIGETTSSGTQTQLRSARPPSYATQAR